MPRIRSLKPGFCTSDAIVRLSIPCRLHFVMLWTYADDAGRGFDNARLLKAALWPLDDDVGLADIESWQEELQRHGRIVRYTDAGRNFFEITNFEEHQHPNRPVPSTIPPPAVSRQCSSSESAVRTHGGDSSVVEGRGALHGGLTALEPPAHPQPVENGPVAPEVVNSALKEGRELLETRHPHLGRDS